MQYEIIKIVTLIIVCVGLVTAYCLIDNMQRIRKNLVEIKNQIEEDER